MVACSGEKGDKALIVFDMDKDYPVVEVNLKEIAEVRYLALENKNDSDYLFTHFMGIYDDYILCFGNEAGDYLFYDWNGKPLNFFSHQGEGPEEYFFFWAQSYDKAKDLLYVYDFPDNVQVYDRQGNYKRGIALTDTTTRVGGFDRFSNFDPETLLCLSARDVSYFLLSKTDGSIRYLNLPVMYGQKSLVAEGEGMMRWTATFPLSYGVRHAAGWYLSNYANDTIYNYTYNHQLVPYFVRRPSVATQTVPRQVDGFIHAGGYLYFTVQDIAYNFRTGEYGKVEDYRYDPATGQFERCRVYNPDFEDQDLHMLPGSFKQLDEVGSTPNRYVARLKRDALEEAYELDKLSGELKRVYEMMDPEDPFLLMIVDMK